MKVLITGAAGFLGRRLTAALARARTLPGPDGEPQPIDRLILFDREFAEPGSVNREPAERVTGDIADPATVEALIDTDIGTIFHLSGVVSSGAEADFDLGYRVNLGGMQNILAACRAAGRAPRLVFASSIAVYGGEVEIDDRTPLTPLTSYGTQKAMCELLIADATRKGFIDGRAVRLSAVVARPGKPNRAASTFASTIIREPLMGRPAVCPVTREVRLPLVSPGRAIDAFLALQALPGATLGHRRSVLLGAVAPTIGEMVEALARVAGDTVAGRIRWEPDPAIQEIVDGWPQRVTAARADALGLAHDRSMDEVIQAFIDEELGGTFVA